MNSLEDNHEDILAKAMRGLGVGKAEVADTLGLDQSRIENVLNGDTDDEVVEGMAEILKLDGGKLLVSSRKAWSPTPHRVDSLDQFNLPFGNMRVNAYLIWDENSKKAWVFDTGPKAEPFLESLEDKGLIVDAIFLTHTHGDHIACLRELKQKSGNPPVFVHKLEQISEANLIDEGFEYGLGDLSLKTLHTHGHSVGGTTFLIDGLEKPVAVVGDALFAGSIGGGMVSYEDALGTNREKIMSLADNTVLCPGHGPVTTVAEEKTYNPFFPEFTGS